MYTLYIRLFRMYIGLFRAYVGLFRAYIGLFCIGLTSLPNRQLQSATSISDSIFVGAISKFPMKIDTSYRSFQSLTALFFQLLEWSGSLSLFVHMYISFRPQVYQHMQHHICIVECEAEPLIKGMRMVRGGGPEDDFLLTNKYILYPASYKSEAPSGSPEARTRRLEAPTGSAPRMHLPDVINNLSVQCIFSFVSALPLTQRTFCLCAPIVHPPRTEPFTPLGCGPTHTHTNTRKLGSATVCVVAFCLHVPRKCIDLHRTLLYV